MKNLTTHFIQQAEKNPGHIAVIDKNDRAYTYDELHSWAANIQQCLKQNGQKVLVAVPMSARLYAVLLALFASGATVIFLDPWLSGKAMNKIIRKVRPDVLIASSKLRFLSLLMPARYKISYVMTAPDFIRSSAKLDAIEVPEEDTALITFTGGTSTGKPSGIERTHGMLSAQLEALTPLLQSPGKKVSFTHYPIFGLAELAIGNTVLMPDFNLLKLHKVRGNALAQRLVHHQAGRLICSPLLLSTLLDADQSILKSLSLVDLFCGGGRISTRLANNTLTALPEVKAVALYGSSEAEPISHTTFQELADRTNHALKGIYVGRPVSAACVKIVAISNEPIASENPENSKFQNPDEPGEIIVTGEHVAKSYFADEDGAFLKNKITDTDGQIWHRTGDIGLVNKNGISLFGRKERAIQKDGQTYHPYPVEEFFEQVLEFDDTAYVQDQSGQICFCIGNNERADPVVIKSRFDEIGYPVDRILFFRKPLPRDPRHRTKLLEHKLINWL